MTSETCDLVLDVRAVADWRSWVHAAERRLEAHGVRNARLDAEVLLADVLGIDRSRLYARAAVSVGAEVRTRYEQSIGRRASREPLQYIRGRQEFYSREFAVDASVLVPRAETETVVEEALRVAASFERPRILDVGTGSGAIAVTLALELPQARVVGTDVSQRAIACARANAERLGTADRVAMRCGDLFTPHGGDRFDVIVSNPPYVASDEIERLEPEVREYEPRVALDGGCDGLEVFRRLADASGEALEPDGALVVEIGVGQRAAVERIFAMAGYGAPRVRPDLAGIERVLTFRRGDTGRG